MEQSNSRAHLGNSHSNPEGGIVEKNVLPKGQNCIMAVREELEKTVSLIPTPLKNKNLPEQGQLMRQALQKRIV